MRRILLTATLLALLATPALAADAAKGLQLAQEKCSQCHAVEKGGAFKLRPPSFQSIAIYRNTDDIWQRIISPNPHSAMPEMQWTLTPDEVQDLVAHITSLDVPVTLAAP